MTDSGHCMTCWEKWQRIILIATSLDLIYGNYRQRLNSYSLLNTSKKRQNVNLWHCAKSLTEICDSRFNCGGFFQNKKQNRRTKSAQTALLIKT